MQETKTAEPLSKTRKKSHRREKGGSEPKHYRKLRRGTELILKIPKWQRCRDSWYQLQHHAEIWTVDGRQRYLQEHVFLLHEVDKDIV